MRTLGLGRHVITNASTRRRLISLSVVGLLAWTLTLAVAGDLRAAAEPESTSLRPNAERPLTHDELLAIRGEREPFDSWGSSTLVAQTVIERAQPLRGEEEQGGGGPAFGSLPRSGHHPGDPVVLASDEVAGRYPSDDSSVSGLLAISDSRTESMQLQGSVETPAGSYVTPIDPAAMAAADALPVGALIVAHGWFSNLRSDGPCPDVPEALDPHDSGGDRSPFVRCPGGWLTVDKVAEVDPDDRTTPLAFGMPVQSGALDQFMRWLREDLRGAPATYLLRHVASPVDGAEPALAWKVVGIVGPVTVPALDPPSDLVDIARPGGLDWQPGMERQPPADGWQLHSTAWEGGFASVRLGRDRVLSSWVSPDGITWQGVELPTDIRTVGALLRLRDGLVLIANHGPSYEPVWRYDVWSSADGLEWQRLTRQEVPTPSRFDGYRRQVHGFWSLGNRVVALATYTTEPCCGRSSGWAVVANRENEPAFDFAWTSRDGKDWRRHRTRGIPADARDHLGHLISQGDGELLALWNGADQSIGCTTDGIRWRTIGHHPDGLDLDTVPTLLERTGEGLVLVGSVEIPGRARMRMTIWRSADGERWKRSFSRFGGRPVSIASSGGTVIVAGNDGYSRGTGIRLPWLMVSEDAGRKWDDSLTWVGDAEWCLGSLTANGSSVSLDAACATPGAASTYVVALPVGVD